MVAVPRFRTLEKHVSLRLVSTSDDRALAIRDHLLPIVRERGTLENQRGPVRLITLEMDPWVFRHWTPFNELSPAEASSPGYRHAVERQHTRPDLPYGLEVWRRGVKMLSVLWADDRALFRWSVSCAALGKMKRCSCASATPRPMTLINSNNLVASSPEAAGTGTWVA